MPANRRFRSGKLAVLALLLLFAVFLALLSSGVPPISNRGENFTEFYLVGPDNKMHDYPRNVTSGDEIRVHVVITNQEKIDTNYTLYAQYSSDVQTIPFYKEQIALTDSQTAERNVTVRPLIDAGTLRVDFLLYKNDALDTPYLTCRLWLNVTSTAVAK
jgi:uncharacterized membrane protein